MKRVFVAERGGTPIQVGVHAEAYTTPEYAAARIEITPLRRLGEVARRGGLEPETVKAYVSVDDLERFVCGNSGNISDFIATAREGEPYA